MTAVPKPVRVEKTPKRLRPVNPERRAEMRARNFPTADLVPQFCLVAHLLAEHQRRHGEKSTPAGWSRCWGPVDLAHVRARGMGGCNSFADQVVRLCRGHHQEQEGRTAVFEARYGVDLTGEAAKYAAGERDPLPPA